jgi:arylsulfatase
LSLLGLAIAAIAGEAHAQPSQADRPNFLVIVADDLGYSDLGAFGGEIETPNLDMLAARGIRFTGFHTSPTCSPTRAMLLTGLDNHEAGLGNMAEALSANQRGRPGYEGFLRSDTATLAELLGNAGYRTLFSGKWHLGLTAAQDPSRRGFQRSFAMLQASHNHFGLRVSTDPAKGFVYRENGRTLASLPPDFYSSDYFTTKMVEQLKDSRSEAEPKPFFAYLAFTAPHWPLQAPEETIAKYAERYSAGYEALRDKRLERQAKLGLLAQDVVPHGFSAPSWDALTPEEKAGSARRMAVYAAMIDRIDFNVGRVIEFLRESGEFDNTVILFLSDNGADGMSLETQTASPGARARYDAADNSLDNIGSATSYCSIGPGWAEAVSGPSWSFKGSETEGGTRVVALLAGPNVRPDIYGGFVSVMDVLPTFLDLAGAPRPGGTFEGRTIRPVRGISWADWLSGRTDRVYPREAAVGAEFLGQRAVRRGDWKLLDPGDGKWRLFDISRDPGETVDLSAAEPARTARLADAWHRYADEVEVALPPAPYKPPGLNEERRGK